MVVNKSLAKRFTHQNDGAIKTSPAVEATFLGGTKIEYSNEVSIDFMTMITLSDFLVFFRHFETKVMKNFSNSSGSTYFEQEHTFL